MRKVGAVSEGGRVSEVSASCDEVRLGDGGGSWRFMKSMMGLPS